MGLFPASQLFETADAVFWRVVHGAALQLLNSGRCVIRVLGGSCRLQLFTRGQIIGPDPGETGSVLNQGAKREHGANVCVCAGVVLPFEYPKTISV